MAWRLSPVTAPSWARTTCTHEALGTDQMRMVASGEAENTKSCGQRGERGQWPSTKPSPERIPSGAEPAPGGMRGRPQKNPTAPETGGRRHW